MTQDEIFMSAALSEAQKAAFAGEVPVGAVIVRNGEVISSGRNTKETSGIATGHAEIEAIEAACRTLGTWRLSDCTLYVTLQPCPMCAGAIVNARVGRVVFGSSDPKAGAMGSVLNFNAYPLNHKPEIATGVLEDECGKILSAFFASKRK